MPAPIYRGTFPVLLNESTRYLDRGKIEYTSVKAYRADNVTTGSIGSSDAVTISGKTLALTSISVHTQDGISEVTHTYSGGDSAAPNVYEVVASVQEEPIASHPAFTTSTGVFTSSIVDAAGSTNVNFDENGIFQSFSKDANNYFFGIQSYLSPQVQYRRIYSTGTAPTAGTTARVATIFSAPDGYPPTIASGRNWLEVSIAIKNNGNQKTSSGQYEITEEYRASGQKGWNPYIYPTSN
jgi:hypothetical protein